MTFLYTLVFVLICRIYDVAFVLIKLHVASAVPRTRLLNRNDTLNLINFVSRFESQTKRVVLSAKIQTAILLRVRPSLSI